MKKIILVVLIAITATSLTFAQGEVNFVTSTLGSSAKVLEFYGRPGGLTGLGNTAVGGEAGNHFLMQLYAGAGLVSDSSSLVPVGIPVNSRNGSSNGGYAQESGTTTLGAVVNTVVSIPFLSPGGPVTLQLRAWWAGSTGNTYTTYEAGLINIDPNARVGYSLLLYLDHTGNAAAVPPSLPVGLDGLQGFMVGIPEPSSATLMLLGAATLAAMRRKGR